MIPACEDCMGEWVDCWHCDGEGFHDLHDDDPINCPFEGVEFDPCRECESRGGWSICDCEPATTKQGVTT